MGWLYMQSLRGHDGPRAYLDDQFTYESDGIRSHVLRSALVGLRTYYAAVQLDQPGKDRIVYAMICLVHYNPRNREGYVFGYKDMAETMGPYEAECPAAILDLLTPTDSEYALGWRAKCRLALERRARKPRLREGWTLAFAEPLHFSDGRSHQRLEVAIDPARPRAIRFRAPGCGTLYRIRNLDSLQFEIEQRG